MTIPLYYTITAPLKGLAYPMSMARIDGLIDSCKPGPGWRVLDLACGRGELLCRWAQRYEVMGTGVDETTAQIKGAQERAEALQVWANLNFVVSEVADYPQPFHQYDLVSCFNPQQFGMDLSQSLETMQIALKSSQAGWLLIAESYWQTPPDRQLCAALDIQPEALPSLGDLLEQFEAVGAELAEMLLATPTEWDQFYAQQWRQALAWLEDESDHPQHAAVHAALIESRRRYLRYERDAIGWGIFLLRMQGEGHSEGRSDSDEDTFDGF